MNLDKWLVFFYLAQIALFIICLVIGNALIRTDGTARHRTPDIASLDWVSIAYLRGEFSAVLEAANVSLEEKGLINFLFADSGETKESGADKKGNSVGASSLDPIERELWGYYQEAWKHVKEKYPKPTPALLEDPDIPQETRDRFVKRATEQIYLPVHQKLSNLRLLISEEGYRRAERIENWILGIMTICGVTGSIIFWKARGEDIISYLLVLLVLLYPFARAISTYLKVPRLSLLGNRFLEELTEHYVGVYQRILDGANPEKDDFVRAVAIFGLEKVKSTSLFPALQGVPSDVPSEDGRGQ